MREATRDEALEPLHTPYCWSMNATETRWGSGVNAEAIQAWDGPLFDRFVQFRHIVTTGLGAHGDEALRLNPPQEGQRVLDIGCGFGDTTQQIARSSARAARRSASTPPRTSSRPRRAEAEEAGVANARFFVADVQVDDLGGPYDAAFSRMGTMFFVSPVAALRNVRKSLVPGGGLTWSSGGGARTTSGCTARSRSSRGSSSRPRSTTSRPAGPGPFSMANADTVDRPADRRRLRGHLPAPLRPPDPRRQHIDEAIEIVMSIGPAGRDPAAARRPGRHLHAQGRRRPARGFAEFQREDGTVWGMASTWIVTATAP